MDNKQSIIIKDGGEEVKMLMKTLILEVINPRDLKVEAQIVASRIGLVIVEKVVDHLKEEGTIISIIMFYLLLITGLIC